MVVAGAEAPSRIVLRGAGRMPLRTNVLRRRPLAVTSPLLRTQGIRPAFGVRRRFLERRLRVLRSPHRTPSLVGTLQPQRRRMKTRVWRMHSARRRTEALAYECPPAPVVGRHLPFTSYARASARRSEFVGASLKGGRACCALLTARRASSGRAGVGKVKEEVAANGRRRHCPGLPVPAGPFSRRDVGRRHACGGCILRGAGRRPCVRMSSGAGRWPSPPLYFVRKGIRPAFGVRRRFLEGRPRVLRSPHRTPSLVGAGRGLGKVKEEVAANGRRRDIAQAPVRRGPSVRRDIGRRRAAESGRQAKRPGRGRDLPGPDAWGGTHAMSVASRQWLFASAVASL